MRLAIPALSLSLLLCAALTATGCAVTVVSPRVLMERDKAFSRAVAERGASGFRDYVSREVVTMPPGQPFQSRRDDWERTWDEILDHRVALSWEPTGGAVDRMLGYTYGTWRLRRKDGSERTGKYFTVWRLEADGIWRVALDGGNVDPPSKPAP
jgi:ketosteroid isomerase-like protein